MPGEANRVGGKCPVRKYDVDGNLLWETLLGPDVSVLSANPVLGGAYVSDQNLGVYRLDSSGNVLWGPKDFGYTADPAAWTVATDVATGGAYATSYAGNVLLKTDPIGNVVWTLEMAGAARATANPLDGGVYVGFGGGYRPNTARVDPQGSVLWNKDCLPSCYTYPRGVNPVDGSLLIAGGWPSLLVRVRADGEIIWSVENDDYAGHMFANRAVAWDLAGDMFYSGENELGHGLSKFDGAGCALQWHVDPGHEGNDFMVFVGLPKR